MIWLLAAFVITLIILVVLVLLTQGTQGTAESGFANIRKIIEGVISEHR